MKRLIICIVLLLVLFVQPVMALECEYAVNEQFQSASAHINGVALVSRDGMTAVIDRIGNYVIDFDERVKKIRGNGLIMIVGDNDLAAFFDSKGNQLTEYVYDTFPTTDLKYGDKTYHLHIYDGDGKSDLVPYSRNKKYGYINPYGTEVVPPVFEYAYGFYNGIAHICSDGVLSDYGTYTEGKYGFIYDNGTVMVPPDSYWVADFVYEAGYHTGTNGEGSGILIDRNGNVLPEDTNGYAPIDVKYISIKDSEGRSGIVDKNRNPVVPLDFYQSIDYLNDDYFIIDSSYIVDNKNQVTYTAPEGVSILPHYTGIVQRSPYAQLVQAEGMFSSSLKGFVTAWGEVTVEPKYRILYDIGEGLIYAQDDSKNYLLDYFGNVLCEISGNDCSNSVDGIFAVTDITTGKRTYMLNPLIHPKVLVNGEKLVSDVYPEIENDRTLIPMRAVFEALDATVDWIDETQTVIASRGDTDISLQIGSNILYKNGEAIEIDVPAKLKYDRTMVPLRAVSEALGAEVGWDEQNKIVTILTDAYSK